MLRRESSTVANLGMKLRGVRGWYERDQDQSAKQTYKRKLSLKGLSKGYKIQSGRERGERKYQRRCPTVG